MKESLMEVSKGIGETIKYFSTKTNHLDNDSKNVSVEELKKAKDDKNLAPEGKEFIQSLLANNETLYKSMMKMTNENCFGLVNSGELSIKDLSKAQYLKDTSSTIDELISYFNRGENAFSTEAPGFLPKTFLGLFKFPWDYKALNKNAFTDIKDDKNKTINNDTSKEIWNELQKKGYINEKGKVLDKFAPDKENFKLDIDSKFARYDKDIIFIMNQDHHISKNELEKAKADNRLSAGTKKLIESMLADQGTLYDSLTHLTKESLKGFNNDKELSLADLYRNNREMKKPEAEEVVKTLDTLNDKKTLHEKLINEINSPSNKKLAGDILNYFTSGKKDNQGQWIPNKEHFPAIYDYYKDGNKAWFKKDGNYLISVLSKKEDYPDFNNNLKFTLKMVANLIEVKGENNPDTKNIANKIRTGSFENALTAYRHFKAPNDTEFTGTAFGLNTIQDLADDLEKYKQLPLLK